MKTLKERTEIQQAFLDGEYIEWIDPTDRNDVWGHYTGDSFNWATLDFRVKPKPMEIWVNVYPSMAREMFDTLATAKRHARTEAIKTIKFIQAPDDEQ